MQDYTLEFYRQMITLGNINAKKIARQTGLSIPTIYKYAEGEISFSLEKANQFTTVTESHELANAMLAGTGFMAVKVPDGDEISIENIEKDQLKLVVFASHAIETIQEALSDGKITNQEKYEINKVLNGLTAKIENLRLKIGSMDKE